MVGTQKYLLINYYFLYKKQTIFKKFQLWLNLGMFQIMTRDCPIGPDFGPGENIRQTNY